MVDTKVSASRISPNLFDRGIVHDKEGTTVELDDGRSLRCKVLVDATGLESKLVAKESPMYARGNDKELITGYQIAYGFIAVVDKLETYDAKAMTLFDYRYPTQ
jgi:flavin-dependent dehydrogenase